MMTEGKGIENVQEWRVYVIQSTQLDRNMQNSLRNPGPFEFPKDLPWFM